jgi:hypothetical protein
MREWHIEHKSSVIGNVVILSSKSRVPVFKNTGIIQDTPLMDNAVIKFVTGLSENVGKR